MIACVNADVRFIYYGIKALMFWFVVYKDCIW